MISLSSFSQVNFDEYQTLAAAGTIPEDFTTETFVKLKEDIKEGSDELRGSKEKMFFENINYAIDGILHSGYVVYGDEVTNYLEKIVAKLLKSERKLKSEIRVYTLKSNNVNAFSTDQGILFVTTGLIAQVTSEAQLALILAHEISHFTEHHVVESFAWKSKNRNASQDIEKLSIYSKDKEFQADKIGLEWYNKAGYSLDEVLPTFDVLMYSYLPFDEVVVSYDYFTGNDYYFPKAYYPKDVYEIKAVDDEDDSESSHPNIKKRKKAISEEIEEFKKWGDKVNPLGEDLFIHVRDIARFESVRNDVIEARYADAIYSIFLLEEKFPNSTYLKRMKAQSWLGLLVYKYNGDISKTLNSKSKLEGAVGSVHHLLKKFKKTELTTFLLHKLYYLRETNPKDKEIEAIWNAALKLLVESEKFSPSKYSDMTFEEASGKFYAENETSDTIVVETDGKKKSKYDRIKSSNHSSSVAAFDSTKYYLYGMNDVLESDFFKSKYKEFEEDFEDEQDKIEAYEKLSDRERKSYDKSHSSNVLNMGVEEIVVVEPTVISYNRNKFNRVKSEKLESVFSASIKDAANELGIKTHSIDKRSLSTNGTVAFNERNVLISYLSQVPDGDDIATFPVDYSLLNEIKNNYGTSKIMFTLVEHQKDIDINWWLVAGSAVMYPTFPFVAAVYVPLRIFKGNHTRLNFLVLDLEKGSEAVGETYYWNEPIYKHNMGSHMYNILYQLNTKAY